MMMPFLVIFFTFTILPVLASIFLGFTNFNVLQPPRFVGLDNYRRLFLEDEYFITALRNTFQIAMFTGPIGYMLSFLMAWLINELTPKLRAFFTVVFYAPSIGGSAFIIFGILFSNDPYGWANAFLLNARIITEPLLFTRDRAFMMPIVIVVSLWMSLGFGFLSFVAGLQVVDRSLYEAGAMDGVKSRWQELWYITLPSMKPQLMFGAVLSITGALGTGAVATALMGFPSAGYNTHTLMHHLQDFGTIRMELGYASSIAVFLFGLMVGANALVRKFIRSVGT
jgi:multiple sugar transport system permease protein